MSLYNPGPVEPMPSWLKALIVFVLSCIVALCFLIIKAHALPLPGVYFFVEPQRLLGFHDDNHGLCYVFPGRDQGMLGGVFQLHTNGTASVYWIHALCVDGEAQGAIQRNAPLNGLLYVKENN